MTEGFADHKRHQGKEREKKDGDFNAYTRERHGISGLRAHLMDTGVYGERD